MEEQCIASLEHKETLGKGKPADVRNKTRLCQTISLYKLLCNGWILRLHLHRMCEGSSFWLKKINYINTVYCLTIIAVKENFEYQRQTLIFLSGHAVKFSRLSDKNW